MKNNTIGEILRNARKATSPVIDLATIKDYINEKMHRDQNGRLVRNYEIQETENGPIKVPVATPREYTAEEISACAEYNRRMRAEDAGGWNTRGE